MKKTPVLITTLLLLAMTASAQSAEKISSILKARETTCAQAAYLAAAYLTDRDGNAVSDELTEQSAFDQMVTAGYISEKRSPDDAIKLKELANMYMHVTGASGGLFYSLFHTPRYAIRDLKARGVIPERADPSQTVNGRDTIAVMNGCISISGGAK